MPPPSSSVARSCCKETGPPLVEPPPGHAVHLGHAVEQARNMNGRRGRLVRETAKGGRHYARIAPLVLGQHRQHAELGGALGPDELLQAWRGPRYDRRALAEGQDRANGVVAAHRDAASRTRHQTFEPGVEGDRPYIVELSRSAGENRSLFRQHERTENEQGRVRNSPVVLVGRQHQIDQSLAVPAAARGDQQEIVDDARNLRGELQLAGGAPQIPGIDHSLVNAWWYRQARERV